MKIRPFYERFDVQIACIVILFILILLACIASGIIPLSDRPENMPPDYMKNPSDGNYSSVGNTDERYMQPGNMTQFPHDPANGVNPTYPPEVMTDTSDASNETAS